MIMEQTDYLVSRFDGAVRLLPGGLRSRASAAVREDRAAAEEIRLRAGWPPALLMPEGEREFSDEPVTLRDIESVIERATLGSGYALRGSMSQGYVTARGGYRIGLGGSMRSDGGALSFGVVTSAAIRVSRQIKGAAAPVMDRLCGSEGFLSTLIVSPPGAGKTTLLREIVRELSDGGCRVSLADERCEVAAMSGGAPGMDVGRRTDVIDGCPKDEAVIMLLRAMNPQVIALDEITAPKDVRAIGMAANCGVRLLATAHAWDMEDLMDRELYRDMVKLKIFKKFVIIRKSAARRRYIVEDLEEYI